MLTITIEDNHEYTEVTIEIPQGSLNLEVLDEAEAFKLAEVLIYGAEELMRNYGQPEIREDLFRVRVVMEHLL